MSEEYEDLGNHSIKAMGEAGFFSLAQVCFSLPFLFAMLFCLFFLTLIVDACRECL